MGKTDVLMMGWEAAVIWLGWSGGFAEAANTLEEPEAPYGLPSIRQMDAATLLGTLEQIRARLRELGVDESQAPELLPPLERLRITREGRLLLPDRYNIEVRMPPLVKTLFLFYLKHPEGVPLGALGAYREELMHIYGLVSPRGDLEELRRSIDRLTDPEDNSVHEKAARLAPALSRYLDKTILAPYLLHGPSGAKKRIPLDRSLVEWE
jgi:hypothetical protein